MTFGDPVAEALKALDASIADNQGERTWNRSLDALAEALSLSKSLHAKRALLASWRARLQLDERGSTGHVTSVFWEPIIDRWEEYDYKTSVLLASLLLWQADLRGSTNTARFDKGLTLWPYPDHVPIARAWSDDETLASYMLEHGSPYFLEARLALLVRETKLLVDWPILRHRLSTPSLIAIAETVPFDMASLIVNPELPTMLRLEAIDGARAMLATTDGWLDEGVEDAVDMFWDRLLPRESVPRPILNRLRSLLIWHHSLGSRRSRRAVEHALDHWPILEEVAALRQRFEHAEFQSGRQS